MGYISKGMLTLNLKMSNLIAKQLSFRVRSDFNLPELQVFGGAYDGIVSVSNSDVNLKMIFIPPGEEEEGEEGEEGEEEEGEDEEGEGEEGEEGDEEEGEDEEGEEEEGGDDE